MKKEAISKSLKILALTLMICLAGIALCGFRVRAAVEVPAIRYADFLASYVNIKDRTVEIQFKTNAPCTGAQVQLCSSSRKVLATEEGSNMVSVSYPIRKNEVYYYRVRGICTDSETGKTAYGSWTKYKAFSTIVLKPVMVKKGSGRFIRVKCPKLPEVVRNVKVMLSTKKNKGYKKVASVKSGKTSKVIKKFRKKKFAYYKGYYVNAAPVLKGKVPCQNFVPVEFWFRRAYE